MPETSNITGELRVEKTEPISDKEIRYLSQDGWKLKELSKDRRVAIFELLAQPK